MCGPRRVKKPPSGREVARRAGGREPRLCPKPSCLREALSPTACGRSPLPEGAKEFFDNLRAAYVRPAAFRKHSSALYGRVDKLKGCPRGKVLLRAALLAHRRKRWYNTKAACTNRRQGAAHNGRRLAPPPKGGETMRFTVTFYVGRKTITLSLVVKSKNRHSAK